MKAILNLTAYAVLSLIAAFMVGLLATAAAYGMGGSDAACDLIGYAAMALAFGAFLAVRNVVGPQPGKESLMLVLGRRIGQELTIETSDGTITIQLCDSHLNSARIGISAPDKCRILRSELTPVDDDAEPMGERLPHPATEMRSRRNYVDPFLPAKAEPKNTDGL